MIRKPVFWAYGIKLIATWMLIPFILMFVPILVSEFSATFSAQEVVLQEETYSGYPDKFSSFKTTINGRNCVCMLLLQQRREIRLQSS